MLRPLLSSMRRFFHLSLAALVLVAGLVSGSARAAQDKEPVTEYTDEDLKRLHSGTSGQVEGTHRGAQSQTRPAASEPGKAQRAAEAGPAQTRPQGGTAAPGGGAPAQGEPSRSQDWARKWQQDRARREYWEAIVRQAEERVQRLQERLAYLERKKASVQNPFLPRPSLSEEDRQAEAGMDAGARLARTEDQISETRRALEEARTSIERERARAQEALRRAGIQPN